MESVVKPTVFIVDDDPVLQDALAGMVIMTMRLNVECYSSARKFLDAYKPSRPGCLVVELRLPGRNGINLQTELFDHGIQLPVIMMARRGDVRAAVQAMKLGAIDFLEKPYQPQQLRKSIRQAIDLDTQCRQNQVWQADIDARLALLTSDEQKVASMIVAGCSNERMASRLNISMKSFQLLQASLMKKLNLKTVAGLVTRYRVDGEHAANSCPTPNLGSKPTKEPELRPS